MTTRYTPEGVATMTTRYTPEALKALLVKYDSGVLKSGQHAQGRDFCAMEFLAKVAGEPWTDNPKCVHTDLASYCRAINDSKWPSDETRTEVMLPLLAEVFGTRGLDISLGNIAEQTIRQIVSTALEAAAEMHPDKKHRAALLNAASRCRVEGSRAATYAASVAASVAATYVATYAASRCRVEGSRAATYAATYAASSAATYAATYAASVAASVAASSAAKVEIYEVSIAIVIAEIQRARAAT